MFRSVGGECWGGWQGFLKGRGSSKHSLRLGILPGGGGDGEGIVLRLARVGTNVDSRG